LLAVNPDSLAMNNELIQGDGMTLLISLRLLGSYKRKMDNFMLIGLLTLTLISPSWFETKSARAEDFAEGAFAQQWQQTDQAVANGQASRTYFWGPQAFAHTGEIYFEAGGNGQRRVQYFDKARMELTKKAGQDPNQVTNGLLTVELVSGQLQVGDNLFLARHPATNPVAGDAAGNENAPTYASFNQGKLAFGVPGASPAPNRTGQKLVEAVDKAGHVSQLSQPPVQLTYARYFGETGHNLADVFNNFFQASPLGEDKWLAVMGYPISEPFWSKDKVIVGGKAQDVLIQLFQRRVLTYTPANPANFQVEMGNIGQHYYAWRYGFDTRDQLPGDYRLLTGQANKLISRQLNSPQSFEHASLNAHIQQVWAIGEGRAVVTTVTSQGYSSSAVGGVYLVDIPRQRPAKSLPVPADYTVANLTASADGRWLAIGFQTIASVGSTSTTIIQLYELGTLATDNLEIRNSISAYHGGLLSTTPFGDRNGQYQLAFSQNGRYLAFFQAGAKDDELVLVDVNTRAIQTIILAIPSYFDQNSEFVSRFQLHLGWIGDSPKLMVSLAGKVLLVDAATGKTQTLLEERDILSALPSPDGTYFALMTTSEPGLGGAIKFRALATPTVDFVKPSYVQSTMGGRYWFYPYFTGWNADGSAVAVGSDSPGPATSVREVALVSIASGKPVYKKSLTDLFGGYQQVSNVKLAYPFYLLSITHEYKSGAASIQQNLAIVNQDGTGEQTLLSLSFPNENWGELTAYAQMPQVIQLPTFK
jgi:hypothetical protein